MRWIYISPHLDDAVFSAGGLIFDQVRNSDQVEVWTILCGTPGPIELSGFAISLHKSWKSGSAAETVRMRREENDRAVSVVGAKSVYFDFLDSMYRCDASG